MRSRAHIGHSLKEAFWSAYVSSNDMTPSWPFFLRTKSQVHRGRQGTGSALLIYTAIHYASADFWALTAFRCVVVLMEGPSVELRGPARMRRPRIYPSTTIYYLRPHFVVSWPHQTSRLGKSAKVGRNVMDTITRREDPQHFIRGLCTAMNRLWVDPGFRSALHV